MMSITTTKLALQKRPPKRVFPLFLLFLAISLLAFLLFVSSNGLPCHTSEHITHHLHFSTNCSITEEAVSKSKLLAVHEDGAHPDLVSQQRSERGREVAGNGSTSVKRNSSFVAKRRMWKANTDLVLRLRHSDATSRRFSARADKFFRGCRSRFFMTWISSLESFGRREMLGMESLFKFHPEACLLVLSNTMDSAAGAKLLRPFADRGFRVSAMSPDYTYLLKNTPAEAWFARLRRGEVKPGSISLGQNLSNLLRLAVLYRFGGTYLDTDVIFIKSIHGLRNFVGVQSVNDATGQWSRLNNAVLAFDKEHPLLYKFIEEFALTFDGSKWGHNGPYLVSRVVASVAGMPGYQFTLLPPEAFYPVGWGRIGRLFHGPNGTTRSRWIAGKLRSIREHSFAVHLWNRESKNQLVEEGSVIAQIMYDACLFCNSSAAT